MSLFNQLTPLRSHVPVARANGDVTEQESYVMPPYNIKESDDAYGLEVLIPGVAKDAVELNVKQDELIVTARRRWKAPEGWSELFRETEDADYRLRFDLNAVVDVDKINAELEQGVLRITMPKAEAVKPRKISIG
jgi:HSP20 family molecular chaperone IbpA